VANQEQMPDSSELRNHLRAQLPEYMIPSAFVGLTALPLTSNGKIDRGRLPVPESLRLKSEAVYLAPQTEIERTVARVLQEVLRIERVGILDNFFDLGAHSILLVQAHSQLQKALNRELPLIELFRYPTIGSLAKHLSQEQSSTPSFKSISDRVEQRKKA